MAIERALKVRNCHRRRPKFPSKPVRGSAAAALPAPSPAALRPMAREVDVVLARGTTPHEFGSRHDSRKRGRMGEKAS
ncbi:hypothetical protein VFPFJ_01574 [Purpureocillium lilacinum]|uniref:Uncharacterized protein n=1 Tax=Purpureocillium lilacinum TaxID=33203 RepID=A0A179HC13_PURLI|nr:hypothetical protein VFPFJ_01574 [Purpureocillium lilacinum]OAQ87502.1 hypothetical protein VFPBJ_01542 [Purpureocillium lilacinum]OAQ95464.1 hypothetical protein VFPFJ_01574 [Purpureocillium lilacinum]